MCCPKCGKENTDTAMFCSTCGNRLSAQASIVQEPVGNLPHSNTELKKTSVVLLIFLTIITFGIYNPAWFLRRRNAINNLQSKEKLGYGVFVFAIVVFSISLFVTLLSGATVPPISPIPEEPAHKVKPHSKYETPFYTNIDPETGQDYPSRMWSSNKPPDYYGKPPVYSKPPIRVEPPAEAIPTDSGSQYYQPGAGAPYYDPDYASKTPGGPQYYQPGKGAPYYSPDYAPKKIDYSQYSDDELKHIIELYSDTPTSQAGGVPAPQPVSLDVSLRGTRMEALFNILVNFVIYFVIYISIPVAIRYAILRRPIQNRWIAIGILVPIFIGFATLVGIQREEGQKRISQQMGIPYRSSPHMFGSALLNGAIVVSYFILRRGRKQAETVSEKSTTSAIDTTNRPTICPKCNAEVSANSIYCHKCGNNISEGNRA